MKTTAAVLLILLAFGGRTLAQAQNSAVDDEATIRSLEDRGRLGVLSRDTVALEQVWSEQFMVNSPRNVVAPSEGCLQTHQ